jgi:hypothetical protein
MGLDGDAPAPTLHEAAACPTSGIAIIEASRMLERAASWCYSRSTCPPRNSR